MRSVPAAALRRAPCRAPARAGRRAAPLRCAAVILAAGLSSRMGAFKPLLTVGREPAVARLVRSFGAAGVDEVLVVTGHRAAELAPVAAAVGARCVHNADYESGMYSSVCAGVRAVDERTDAVFLMPVDIPLVASATLRRLARAHAAGAQAISYPCAQGRRGHPPLADRRLLLRAIDAGLHARLSTLLAAHAVQAAEVAVDDPFIHRDMDTPQDYARLCAALEEVVSAADQARGEAPGERPA